MPCLPSRFIEIRLDLFTQIYLGTLRGKTAVRRNCNIRRDLQAGNLVAVNHPDWVGTVPQIAKVMEVSTDRSKARISWLDHERAPHKPIWMRGFRPSKYPDTFIDLNNILLYDFELNQKAKTLKKATREELQQIYSELREGEWKDAIQAPKRRRI